MFYSFLSYLPMKVWWCHFQLSVKPRLYAVWLQMRLLTLLIIILLGVFLVMCDFCMLHFIKYYLLIWLSHWEHLTVGDPLMGKIIDMTVGRRTENNTENDFFSHFFFSNFLDKMLSSELRSTITIQHQTHFLLVCYKYSIIKQLNLHTSEWRQTLHSQNNGALHSGCSAESEVLQTASKDEPD